MIRLPKPKQSEGHGLPPVPAFDRMKRMHSLMTVGETSMAIALADSMFLSVSPDAARGKVLFFLLISMAPFVVVSPLIAPRIDRIKGGHRMVVIFTAILRALVLIGISQVVQDKAIARLGILLLLVFCSMILGKTYAIAKSAIVPTLVGHEDELVGANSKLGQIAGITGFVAAVPAGILQMISPKLTLAFGAIAFLFAGLNAYRLPKVVTAARKPDQIEIEEMKSSSVVTAANAMRILRGSVGFMFFHLAFWLRGEVAGTAWFGLAIAMTGIAVLIANTVGSFIKRHMHESTMMMCALLAVAIAGIIATWFDRVVGGILLAATVNAAATIGKLSFESTVQSDAPDANRGRVFAKCETQNQLAWVIGGVIPVLFSPSGEIGFAIVALVGIIGSAMYFRAGGVSKQSRGERATGPERLLRSE